jgi:hypothetical protein
VVKGLSYVEAVKLLGGSQDKILTALDRLTGGILLDVPGHRGNFAFSLFEPASKLPVLCKDLISAMRIETIQHSRMARTERLVAIHTVIVLSTYFEALRGRPLPFELDELELVAANQTVVAIGSNIASDYWRALASNVLQNCPPTPAPQFSYDMMSTAIVGFYRVLSSYLRKFVEGLEVWERNEDDGTPVLRASVKQGFSELLDVRVPMQAISLYDKLLKDTVKDFPELAFWANIVDKQADFSAIKQSRSGLLGMEESLQQMAFGRAPDRQRQTVSDAYQAKLRRPVLSTRSSDEELHIPSLDESYINPDFRVSEVRVDDQFGQEQWWEPLPVRQDIQEFFVGHVTSPGATEAPLVILGQPGSGKSLLTQVLAARLPPSEFLAVRVVLRDVPADADLQKQIEYAIRTDTGEDLPWRDLVRNVGDAIPVILIDGFDELLQATGVRSCRKIS